MNTAPLALLLFSSSFVSWPLAKALWTAANIVLALAIPHLLLAAFPCGRASGREERWALVLAFCGFASTRAAMLQGQTSLLVFALMLASWALRTRSEAEDSSPAYTILAGLCLGMALSKYSLALPAALALLPPYRRKDGVILGLAFAVQLLGVLLLAGLVNTLPVSILYDYMEMFRALAPHSAYWGAQLVTLLEGPAWPWIIAGVITLLASALLLGFTVRRRPFRRYSRLAEYHALVILLLITLLVSYHRVYDVMIAAAYLPLGWYASRHPASWRLTMRQAWLLKNVTLTFAVALLLPSPSVGALLSPARTQLWVLLVRRAVQSALVVALAVTVWLLVRLGRASAVPATSAG